MLPHKEPPPLSPHQPVLYIEYCRSYADYRRRATELHAGLAEALRTFQPDMELQLCLNWNNMSRHGAFEVAIASRPTDDVAERHILWTGLNRVPISAKVPHVDDIIAPACTALRLRHSQAIENNVVHSSDRHIQKILQRRSLS